MSWSIFLFTGLRLVPGNALGRARLGWACLCSLQARNPPKHSSNRCKPFGLTEVPNVLFLHDEPSPWLQVVVHQDKASHQRSKEVCQSAATRKMFQAEDRINIQTIVEVPASSPPCPLVALTSGPASFVQNTNANKVDGICSWILESHQSRGRAGAEARGNEP